MCCSCSDAIFQAMLAKEPESRLQSMAEVIEQVEACRVVLRANSDNLLVIDGGSVVSKEPAPEDSTVDLNPTPKTETNDPFTFLRPEVPGPDVEDLPSQAPANPDAKRTWAKIAVKGLAAATVIVACVVIFRVAPSHTTSTRAVVFSTTPPDMAPSDTSVATTSSAPPSEDSPKPTVVSVQDSSPAMLPPTNQGPLAESKAAKTEAGPTDPTAASKNSPVKVIADMEKLSGPEQVLRDNGLIKNGRRFLLDEATAVAKYLESKSKLEELQKVTMKKAAIEEYDLLSVGCGDNFQRFSAAGLRGRGSQVPRTRSHGLTCQPDGPSCRNATSHRTGHATSPRRPQSRDCRQLSPPTTRLPKTPHPPESFRNVAAFVNEVGPRRPPSF